MSDLRGKFLAVETEMNQILIERSAAIRGVILATLSSTNLLLLGPAGIAKSLLINEWNKRITGSKYFGWLLTKFSTPEELFGPISLKGLEEERYYRVTKNKLPEANTAFLDEIFKANSSILNALLTVLNERIFYNDGVALPLDLVTIAGASNEIPDSDDGLDAFFDRFLLKYHLHPIHEPSSFVRMLQLTKKEPTATVSLMEIRAAQEEIDKITIDEAVYAQIVKVREAIRKDVAAVSDRTFKTSMGILKAEAWLSNQTEVTSDNIELFRHIAWTKPEQEKSVHSLILELISPEKNKIVTLYNDVQDLVKQVYKHKDAAKRQTAVIEAAQKIRDARMQIAQLKRTMAGKKQDIVEVEKMETELEQMNMNMARDLLGVDLAKMAKT
jgi:MoxR-like ATPase